MDRRIKKWILFGFLIGQLSPGVAQSRRKVPDSLEAGRAVLLTAGSLAAYSGSLVVLGHYWYTNYPRTRFHFFNDDPEWMQMDKAGHAWTSCTLAGDAAAACNGRGSATGKVSGPGD